MRIGPFAALELHAEQQGGDACRNRGCEAGAALEADITARGGAKDVLAWRQNSLGLINVSPIADVERRAARVHRADRQDGVERRRDMQTIASVIAGSRHHQDVSLGAGSDGFFEQRLRIASRAQLAAADVDDMRAVFDRLQDRARQIDLRTHDQRVLRPAGKDRRNDAAAGRRDPLDGAARLPENNAGDMGAVSAGRPGVGAGRHERFDRCKPRTGKARMREIDRPIKHGDANARVAARFGPDRAEIQDLRDSRRSVGMVGQPSG